MHSVSFQQSNSLTSNPTDAVSLNFSHYLTQRKASIEAHFEGGAPNYAFSLDKHLQKQISSIAPLRSLVQNTVSFAVPLQKQIQQMHSVAVGPRQLPEIYRVTEHCARILGIGIPQVFICPDPDINACTIATDDVSPIILLSAGLVERMSLDELQFVIGHECGHIHNRHGSYNTAVELMTNTMVRMVLKGLTIVGFTNLLYAAGQLMHGGIVMFLNRWSRCAEITCDRAGLICCGDLEVAQTSLVKLVVGSIEHIGELNVQAFIEQTKSVNATPVRMMELFRTHPLIPKRIETLQHFANCQTFYEWQPNLAATNKADTKEKVDQRCERILAILNNSNKSYA